MISDSIPFVDFLDSYRVKVSTIDMQGGLSKLQSIDFDVKDYKLSDKEYFGKTFTGEIQVSTYLCSIYVTGNNIAIGYSRFTIRKPYAQSQRDRILCYAVRELLTEINQAIKSTVIISEFGDNTFYVTKKSSNIIYVVTPKLLSTTYAGYENYH